MAEGLPRGREFGVPPGLPETPLMVVDRLIRVFERVLANDDLPVDGFHRNMLAVRLGELERVIHRVVERLEQASVRS